MQNSHHSSSEEKQKHYALVKKYFIHSALEKNGYCTITKTGKCNIWQLKTWKICTTILDDLIRDNSKNLRIADIGCGRGDFTLQLKKRYPYLRDIIGIDFLEEMIEIAINNVKNIDNITFICGNMLNVPLKNKKIDITICTNLIHHIHKDDAKEGINELARITNKYLIIEIRNKDNIFKNWFTFMAKSKVYQDLPVLSNSVSEISEILKNQDFRLLTTKGIFPFNFICRRLVLVYKKY